MLQTEKRIMDWIEEHRMMLFLFIVTALGILVRSFNLDLEGSDAQTSLLPWYDAMKEGGGLAAMDESISNYALIYQFLIALMTYLPFDPLRMYKYLSCVFDFLMAIGAAGFLYDLTGRTSRLLPAAGYTAILFLPTVITNSALLAQCDAIYTCFCVWAVWFLYKKRFTVAFLFWGLGFSFKLQALFMLPFFLIYYFREKRFSILNFLWLPGMLYLTSVPGLLAGRSLLDPIRIYLHQTETYDRMYLSFASFWNLLSENYYIFKNVAIVMTIVIFGIMLLFLMERGITLAQRDNFLLLMCWSAWTCVMFLPCMHERYAYMVDILLIILAVYHLSYAPYAIAAACVSTVQYSKMFGELSYSIASLAVVYLSAYSLFTWKMLRDLRREDAELPGKTSGDRS